MGALSHYLKSDETMICLDVQLYFSPNNADADAEQMLSQRTIVPRTVIFDQISLNIFFHIICTRPEGARYQYFEARYQYYEARYQYFYAKGAKA